MNTALAQAVRLTPVVEKVHGAHHPELHRVRELTQALAADTDGARTGEYFDELRKVTDNYAIPADVCEGFVGAYRALEEAEKSWSDR